MQTNSKTIDGVGAGWAAPLLGARAAAVALLRRDAAAIVWFLLVALLAVAPILPDPRNRVLGPLGDNVLYVYTTGWTAQALLLGQSPFLDPRLNYPDGLPLASNDSPYVTNLLVAPATLLLGPVFGYNLVIFLSHFLSGYFTYLWARSLTGSRLAAALAGTAFVLAPFRILRSLGHANIVSTQMLPLFFWALDRCVGHREVRELRLWLLGLATLLVAGSSQYLLVIALVSGAVYALCAILPDVGLLFRHGWRVAVSVLLGGLLGSLPSISVLGSGAFEPFNVGRTRLWSADPLNFLLPSHTHPLWGALIDSLRPEPYAGEKTLYLGAVTTALALIGAYHLLRAGRRRLLVWGVTALWAAVLALGTDLWINNAPLRQDDPIWLPAYYLAQLPLVSIMRVWARFGVITIFLVAMLAAFGALHLLLRAGGGWRRGVVAATLLALLLLDLLPGALPSADLRPRAIDRWLAQQEGDFAVAFLPVDKPLINNRALFGSLFHGKQLPAFIHAVHMPRAYEDFAAMALEFPSDRAVGYMAWRGFRYLILDRQEYNGWRAPEWAEVEQALAGAPGLRPVAEVDSFIVLAVEGAP